MTAAFYELNMDGLVGPTHHYAGLAFGNMASLSNAQTVSNPQKAALQGLAKMRLLMGMGIKQAVLPPHQRPNLELLRRLGFAGEASRQVSRACKEAPELLSACYSASSMWTANAATSSSSLDTEDGKVHFTAANLLTNLHRHQEALFSHTLLATIFSNTDYFHHHPPLPQTSTLSDEGAANHSRICASHDKPSVSLFVYGKEAMSTKAIGPKIHPARQTLEASQAIARSHRLNPQQVIFAQQNPVAIDKGVFHNDVIAVANESVLLLHEQAFLHQEEVLKELKDKARTPLTIIELKTQQLSIEDAVASYLFNSQLITLPKQQQMILIAPSECENHPRIKDCIAEVVTACTNPITAVHYLDLKQSMRNGGGPACLRLRVLLSEEELAAMHQGVIATPALLDTLEQWVLKHYRTELTACSLHDPLLITETFTALDELTSILALGSIYPFQHELAL